MRSLYSIIFLQLMFCSCLLSQDVKKDSDGKLIIENPDGSWRYLEPSDSNLLDKAAIIEDSTIVYAAFRQKFDLATSYLETCQAEYDRECNLYYEQEAISLKTTEIGAKKEQQQITKKYNRNRLQAKKKLKHAQRIMQLMRKYQRTSNYEAAQRVTIPVIVQTQSSSVDAVAPDKPNVVHTVGNFFKNLFAKKTKQDSPVQAESWLPGPAHLDQHPHTSHCPEIDRSYDAFTNNSRATTVQEIVFRHCDEALRAYMGGQDYMLAKGSIISVSGGYRYLQLQITIRSRNAIKDYGFIASGSILNMKMMDGETVSLFCQNPVRGKRLEDQTTSYTAIYPIDYQKQKRLEKSPLDKMRIVWSSGYEDYEVSNIDFFQKHFSCLEQ